MLDRSPQAQEEQAGNAAQQPQRQPGEQPVKGQPQSPPEDPKDSQQTRSGKPPPPRRQVEANIATMPPPSAPPSYGPVLNPAGPQTPVPPQATGGLPPPAPITTCTGAQCRDASGNIYGTGIGNAAVNSQGQLCNRSTVTNTMNCF
jgi:hypothetical protein